MGGGEREESGGGGFLFCRLIFSGWGVGRFPCGRGWGRSGPPAGRKRAGRRRNHVLFGSVLAVAVGQSRERNKIERSKGVGWGARAQAPRGSWKK